MENNRYNKKAVMTKSNSKLIKNSADLQREEINCQEKKIRFSQILFPE